MARSPSASIGSLPRPTPAPRCGRDRDRSCAAHLRQPTIGLVACTDGSLAVARAQGPTAHPIASAAMAQESTAEKGHHLGQLPTGPTRFARPHGAWRAILAAFRIVVERSTGID